MFKQFYKLIEVLTEIQKDLHIIASNRQVPVFEKATDVIETIEKDINLRC